MRGLRYIDEYRLQKMDDSPSCYWMTIKKNAISLHDWRVHANRHKSAVDVTDSDSANQRKGIMTLKCVCVCVCVCCI